MDRRLSGKGKNVPHAINQAEPDAALLPTPRCPLIRILPQLHEYDKWPRPANSSFQRFGNALEALEADDSAAKEGVSSPGH